MSAPRRSPRSPLGMLPVLGLVAGCAASTPLPGSPARLPEARGTLEPVGPPSSAPVRVDAGGSCVVDLRQDYRLSGTLSGSAQIDYRILVEGPCPTRTPTPGRYDERWIAWGRFVGTVDGDSITADFTYTARVDVGGIVDGRIVLGGRMTGTLAVEGRMADGRLSYAGEVARTGLPPENPTGNLEGGGA